MSKSGMYYIVYNEWDDCVEYCKNEPHWNNGNKCWGCIGESGMISYKSCYSNHTGGPMLVYLTEEDMA